MSWYEGASEELGCRWRALVERDEAGRFICQALNIEATGPQGLSATSVSHIPLRQFLTNIQLVQWIDQMKDPEAWLEGLRQSHLQAGPKGHPPEFYARVAAQWLGARLERRDPTHTLAQRIGVSDQTIRHWLGRARHDGYLPPKEQMPDYLARLRALGRVVPWTKMQRPAPVPRKSRARKKGGES